ncbi:MAG: hypothetical protein ACOYBR_04365, partial [Fluviibacter sp.]
LPTENSTNSCLALGEHYNVTDRIANGEYLILHPGIVYRKSVVHKIGGYNINLKSLEDNDIYLGISSVARLFHVGIPLVYYRRLVKSESRKTPQFAALAKDYLESKVNLLKYGYTVDDANKLLIYKQRVLNSKIRTRAISKSEYYLDMGWSFLEGGRRYKSLVFYGKAFISGAGLKDSLFGFLKCFAPQVLIKFIRNIRL